MRLVSYTSSADSPAVGGPRAGVLVDGAVVDAATCAARAELDPAVGWTRLRRIVADASAADRRALQTASVELASELGVPREDVLLGPPIPDPGKILCVGLNYRDHVEESGGEPQEAADPVIFAKFATALRGDREDVVLPAAAPSRIDYEGELALVIGRACTRVEEAAALDHVAGYMPFNDVSARDLQVEHHQWTMAKGFDGSAPCGPALVTSDEVRDPQALQLTTTLNGEVVQSTSTARMIHPIARVIAYVSSLITLLPGDVIATGTPAGVGHARDPQRYLSDGDRVAVRIDGIGELSNVVRGAR
ncbi:fumarylacetoacetate hydrolase family protein [Conexibacter sp. CPCC 206217]|uniref:fumarylacetoacetate hydrolase family protein n=1 Tax=Conexibacter sp. CPCC 206217 TaxID=3064574 RepID=UPI002725C364|nr:fumarylacetoacetate hydrolase family protein [Conexibacter sp. CPCC 206217]MDO8210142.1 fumarylacetoacetate hydrolase family protein [Conexibacter sp. CPCC 206217]